MKAKKIKNGAKKLISEVGFSKDVKSVILDFGIIKSKSKSRHMVKGGYFYIRTLAYLLMSIFTVFALMPYAYWKYCNLKYKESYIDGKRLVFVGDIRGAYQNFVWAFIPYLAITSLLAFFSPYILEALTFEYEYINNLIVSLINSAPTILFTSLVISRFYVWQHKNLRFISKLDEKSYYEFHLLRTIIHSVLRKVVLLVTIGLTFPLILKLKKSYMINREFLSDIKLAFNGSIISAYLWLFVRLILVFITFGVYLPYFLYKFNCWAIEHTHISENQIHAKRSLNLL